jgi:plastocyanin/mono/diheme cytochrome c family protein
LLALVVAIIILVGLPGVVIAYRFGIVAIPSAVRTIDIVAAAPEQGGFQPDLIQVAAGETVRLHFSVPDVTHGIAIGPGLGIDLGQVDPGHVADTTVKLDRPGRYTIYCNSWCSPNHWRMRATLEVYDPNNPDQLIADQSPDPVVAQLLAEGVDIDADHTAAVVPATPPDPLKGRALLPTTDMPGELMDTDWRRAHSPRAAYDLLRRAAPDLSEGDAWDAVAFLWLQDLTPERRESAATRFAKNCAACHNETGDGQGPGAEILRSEGLGRHAQDQHSGTVAAFSDPHAALGGSGDIYYAKIRRGGMGTGMPSFGPIFTEEETWELVDYLWTFQFDGVAEHPPAEGPH